MVYRGGGKPPDESMGLGIKSSGAKFICRSQARTMAHPSTATSSTAQIGGYGGKICFYNRFIYFISSCEYFNYNHKKKFN